MSDSLQVEILDCTIDEIDDTNDLLLERVKRLEKFRSKHLTLPIMKPIEVDLQRRKYPKE